MDDATSEVEPVILGVDRLQSCAHSFVPPPPPSPTVRPSVWGGKTYPKLTPRPL